MTSHGDMMNLYAQLRNYTESGIPPRDAFEQLSKTTQNRTRKRTFENVVKELKQGRTLAAALDRRYTELPKIDRSLIAIAEESGKLDFTFARLEEEARRRKEQRNKIFMSTVYPVFLLYAVMTIPNIPTLVMGGLEAYMERIWPVWPFTGLLLFLWYGMPRLLRIESFATVWGYVVLSLPYVNGIARRTALERYCQTMYLGLSAGVPILRCVALGKEAVGNAAMVREFERAERALLRGGVRYAESINEHVTFPERQLQMLQSGEATGHLDEMHHRAALQFREHADAGIRNLLVGVFAGSYAIAVIMIAITVIQFYQRYFAMLEGL